MSQQTYDVVIIGAGPSGAVAGAMLVEQGLSVIVLEKQHFPRFSIGESLLPQCMTFLKEAGLDDAVHQYASKMGFQFKNGAAFHRDGIDTGFDFTEKFTDGPGTTYQVKRGVFDKVLADEAQNKGVEIRYGHQVNQVASLSPEVVLDIKDEQQHAYQVNAKFLLDASGFGRVLPRLLNLEKPSNFPIRRSCFSHFEDSIDCDDFDRDKILITVHPEHYDIWYWLIPFSDGTASVGVVARPEYFNENNNDIDELNAFIEQAPNLNKLLKNAKPIGPARSINGYSADVTTLHGENFALLGNAGEFLDPVFSSGVTIALKSASLASKAVIKQLNGEVVDWQAEYAQPLSYGVNAFRCFVEAWYDQRFQDIIFHDKHDESIRKMISSILAGYAWDENNPFVAQSERRLNVLKEYCQ